MGRLAQRVLDSGGMRPLLLLFVLAGALGQAAPSAAPPAAPPSPDPAAESAPRSTASAERETRRLYLRARSAVGDGQYREALELYRQVITREPDDAVVRFEYAQLLRDLNIQDEAIKQAREAVRIDPKMAEAHRLLGSLELAGGEKDPARLDRGIEELQQARRLAPDDVPTAAALARALLARGRAGEAAQLLDELPETRMQPALLRLAAEARAKSGRSSESQELYKQLLEADPNDREIAAALIDVYEEDDRYDEALELLAVLKTKDPENSAIDERITLDLARAGRFEEAEKRARELATRRPENRDIRRLLAQVLFEKGDVAGGEKILRDLLQTDPQDEGSRRALAGELLRERRFDDAAVLLADSAKRAANDPKATEQRQWAAREQGYMAYLRKDYAGAKKILEPLAIAAAPVPAPEGGGKPGAPQRAVDQRAMRLLLACARDAEDYAYGLAKAKAAAAVEPRNVEWEAAIAEFQYRTGNKAAANATLAPLTASQELDRVMAAADVMARVKDYAGAAQIARDAAKRFPESTEVLFRLASSLERAGSPAEAEKIFLRLLEKKPNDAATLNYLGYMWADKNVHLERAKEFLEKAVAREPRNGAFRDSLGWAYFRLGNFDAA